MVTAHAAGLTIDEASASVATLSQVSGNHGIRRISNEFDNLARSMLDVTAVEKRVKGQLGKGFAFDEGKFAAASFIEKLQYLAQVSGGLKDQYNQAQLSQIVATAATMDDAHAQEYLALKLAKGNASFLHMVGGAAAFIPALILLSGHSATYNDILSHMKDRTDIVTAAFDNMRNTVGQQWKMLETRLQNIAIVIGLTLLPYLKTFLMALSEGANHVMAFVQSAGGIDMIASAVRGLALIIAVMLIPAMIGLVTAMAPIVLTTAAFVVAAILVGKAIDAVSAQFGGWGTILKQVQPLLDVLKQGWAEIQAVFKSQDFQSAFHDLQVGLIQLKPIAEILAMVIGVTLVVAFKLFIAMLHGGIQFLAPFLYVINAVMLAVGAFGQLLIDVFTGKGDKIRADLAQLWGAIQLIFLNALDAITSFFDGFFSSILGSLGTSGDKVKAGFAAIWRHITEAVESALHHVGDFFGAIGTKIVATALAAWNAVSTFLQGIGHAVAAAAGSVAAGFRAVVDAIGDALTDAWHATTAAIVGAALAVWHAIEAAIHTAIFAIVGVVLGLMHAIVDAWNWLYNHNYYVHAIVDAVVVSIRTMVADIQIVFHALIALVTNGWHSVQSTTTSTLSLITRMILTAWHSIHAVTTSVWSFISGAISVTWHAITAQVTQAVAFLTLLLTAAWIGIQATAQTAWALVQQYIVTPIEAVLTLVTQTGTKIGTSLQTAWSTVKSDAANAWANFVSLITGIVVNITNAVKLNIIDPITNAIGGLVRLATTWGSNLIGNFIAGITSKIQAVKDAVGQVAGAVGNFLGFHSPSKEGPGQSAHLWSPNLMNMLSAGIIAGTPQLHAAALRAATALSAGLSGQASIGVGVAGGSSSSIALGSSGGAGGVTIHASFPNATSKDEIKAAFADMMTTHDRATWRKTRTAGYGSGQTSRS